MRRAKEWLMNSTNSHESVLNKPSPFASNSPFRRREAIRDFPFFARLANSLTRAIKW